MTMTLSADDIARAVLDPASVFAAPVDVLMATGVVSRVRIEILRRWQQDAQQRSASAEVELAGGSTARLLDEVLAALHHLGARPVASARLDSGTGVAKLTEDEFRALNDALDDEYRAWSTYDQVIADFGKLRPFINIRDAQARHIEALASLCNRYGLEVPPNRWFGKADRYWSLREACEAAVSLEAASAKRYEQHFAAVSAKADISEVFRHIRAAARERHLPAFHHCAQREAGGAEVAGTVSAG